jgi:hypothetical protein
MLSLLIYLINKFYKLCTYSEIRRTNAAVHYIIVQQKKRSIPVDFDGSYFAGFISK